MQILYVIVITDLYVLVSGFVFHIMKFYEIKLHLRGVYVMREYSIFIQFMGLFFSLQN